MDNILFTPNAAYSPITSWSSPIHGSLQVDWDSAQDFPWLALSPKGNIRSFTNAINLSENDAIIGYQREGDDTFLVDWAVRDSSGNLRKKVTLQPNIQEEFSERLSRGAIASDGSLYLLFQGRTLINYDSQGKEIRRFAAPLNHRYQDIAIDSAGDLYVSGYKSIRSPGPDTPFLEKRSGANGEIVWTSTPIKDRDTNNFNGNVRLSSNAIAILSDGTVLQTISGYPFGINESSGLYIMRINGGDGSLQSIVKIDNDASYFSNALFAQNNSIILRTAQGAYSILLDAQPVAFSSELIPITSLNPASTDGSSVTFPLGLSYDLSTIVNSMLGSSSNQTVLSAEPINQSLSITTSTWTRNIIINYVSRTTNNGDRIDAKQVNLNLKNMGSILQGGNGNDQLMGKAGWDVIDGGAGNDLIRGGNGRDIITGGPGADELHGDFGWNTYRDERDGSPDLIVIKSDHFLVNWLYGQAGNNPNGEKADIIEGLDPIDRIRIKGVTTEEITFASGVSNKGVTGIGIYGKGALEAVYIGGDLSIAQLANMTSGDASLAAMNNQIASYGWTANPGTFSPQLIG